MKDLKVTLFIPTKNEIVGSKEIMPRIDPSWVDEILVVDGQSTDGTPEYYRSLGHRVITQTSDGICGAYWDCVENTDADVIIAFSPDNNSIPEIIPDVVAKLREGYDLVTVSRYLNGAKSDDDDIITAFGNRMFTFMVRLLFKSKCTDSLVMFRGFRRKLAYELQFTDRVLPVFELQLQIRTAIHQLRYIDIPGDEPKRIGGVRKMRPLYNGSAILYTIIKDFLWYQPRFLLRRLFRSKTA